MNLRAVRLPINVLIGLFLLLAPLRAETARERPRPPGGHQHVKGLLQKVVLPEVRFKEASVRLALHYLSRATDSILDPGMFNMVCLWTDAEDKNLAPLTLELENVSVWDAYLAASKLAGLHLRVERNVVFLEKTKPPAEAKAILTGPRFDSKIERDMDAILIPEIRFSRASVSAVVPYLLQQMETPKPEDEALWANKPSIQFMEPSPRNDRPTDTDTKGRPRDVFGFPVGEVPQKRNIEPTITIDLREVSLLDAFHLSLHLYGLSYRVIDNRIELFESP